MRTPLLPALSVCLALSLAACGGGGDAVPVVGKATLSGAVTEIDGSTASRGGVELVLMETGERVITAPDGSFAFKQAPTGSMTLVLANAQGATATLGEEVYTAKCSLCHGADGSGPPNARGATAEAYAAALARGSMASITLTQEEYDAVFAFLSDSPSTPPPPPPPPPPPADESDGATLYRSLCASCHGDFDTPANAAGGNRRVLGARACAIEGSLFGTSEFPGGVPEMASLQSLSDAQIDAIATYLDSQAVSGQERYEANCAGCHGMTGEGGRSRESVRGEEAYETREAIIEESAMHFLACLSDSDIDAIAGYLGSLPPLGDDDDDESESESDDGEEGEDEEHEVEHEGDDGHHGEDSDDDADEHDTDEHDVDDVDDGDEIGETETEVEVHRVEDGEHVHVRIRIRDGRVERADVSRSGRHEREAEVSLRRTAGNGDPDMKGEIEVEVRDDRQRFEIEVEHATPGLDLEAFVIAPDGGEESLGTRTVDTLGEAEWEIKTSDGGRLPFGVAGVGDLVGYDVVVRAVGDGSDLLTGSVPDVPVAIGPQ